MDAIKKNDVQTVENILNIIKIPEIVFVYEKLKVASIPVLKLLLQRKHDFDSTFTEVCTLLHVFNNDIKNDDYIIKKEELELLTDHLPFKEKDYNLYILMELFCNKETLTLSDRYEHLYYKYNFVNYKNMEYYISDILCKSAYCADSNFLYNFITAVNIVGLLVRFYPNSRCSHQQVLQWILLNISGGQNGLFCGIQEGPHSGSWPSSNVEDYVNTYDILKRLL